MLSHNSLENYYREIATFLSQRHNHFTLTEIENMSPGEFMVYAILFANKEAEYAEGQLS